LRLFILPVLRESRASALSVHLLWRSLPSSLSSFRYLFFPFATLVTVLSELVRYNSSLSLSLSLFCLSLAILSSLLSVFSSNRKLLRQSINPSLFQRDDSKYTLTPLPFPVTFSFISWTRAAIFHPFDFHERHSLLICPSSCSLVFSLFLAGF